MTDSMMKFVSRPQQQPEKRLAGERRQDFGEIQKPFGQDAACGQSERCAQCGIPFCQTHCPLHNNIPDWLMLTAAGRLREAWDVASATNFFPEICGRICPQDRLCEGGCVIEQSGHGSVTIGSVEKHIGDTAWEQGWVASLRPAVERRESVAIIGGGPAGLAAAARLRQQGHAVHVYDRYDRAGGLLIYGIPNFKLDKAVVARRIDWLRDSGVVFHLNQTVGETVSFASLRARHDAVLIATGVYKPRMLDLPAAPGGDTLPAMTYLTASNRQGLGDHVEGFASGRLNAAGKEVVVIGGGDTAMDCVRTAVRQGAKSVTCLYRRDRDNMPGSRRETMHAEEEGVRFAWLTAPSGFALDRRGGIAAVETIRMRLSAPDSDGRRRPQPEPGDGPRFSADMVILALGFDAEDLRGLWGEPALPVTAEGTIAADPETGATALPGVFAAGDIVRGASLVVWAVRDGVAAADAIAGYLRGKVAVAA